MGSEVDLERQEVEEGEGEEERGGGTVEVESDVSIFSTSPSERAANRFAVAKECVFAVIELLWAFTFSTSLAFVEESDLDVSDFVVFGFVAAEFEVLAWLFLTAFA